MKPLAAIFLLACNFTHWRSSDDIEPSIHDAFEAINTKMGVRVFKTAPEDGPSDDATILLWGLYKPDDGELLGNTFCPPGTGVCEIQIATHTPPFCLIATTLHELGHSLGLGHNDIPGNVMNGTVHAKDVCVEDQNGKLEQGSEQIAELCQKQKCRQDIWLVKRPDPK